MDPLQFEKNSEGSSVSLRDNDQAQFFFKNNLTRIELSYISSEIFDENSFDEE
ncbi:6281_t:CDS:1, partial [Gigaspora margarita]